MTSHKLRDATKAESIPRSLNLSEKIMGLRIAAAAIYDRAKVMGKSQEDASKDIQPIRDELTKLIASAVEFDLAGCVMTVNRLRAQAKAHETDMKFLMQKAVDCEDHANRICKAIVDDMKAKKIGTRHDRDFSAVLTLENGQERLELR
jgi:hypothetical protein